MQVARFLMDTSASQFYPTVFPLATDNMDMLGDMVWERIGRKLNFQNMEPNYTLYQVLPSIYVFFLSCLSL